MNERNFVFRDILTTEYHSGTQNFTVMTLEKYEQKETEITTFQKALCYLWLKQRTYYANVKENFSMEVTVVS